MNESYNLQEQAYINMIDAKQTDIFISYRRVDGRDYARNIHLALGKEGFQNVFFDYNSMREGMFNEQILTAISHCKDFILVLSPQSMLRCGNEGDWVAIEIQAAIEAGCKIIPVQINDSFTNWPSNFPPRFNFIKQIEFLTLRTDEYFDASISRLISWLDSKPTKVMCQAESDNFILEIKVDETCELQIDGQKVRKIKAGKNAFIDNILMPGKSYKLTFITLASKSAPYTIDYQCSDTVRSGYLNILFSEIREHQKLAEKLEKERKEAELKKIREHEIMHKTACQQYDDSWLECCGMTAVMKNHKIGFLNNNCFEAIPCIYDNASEFCNGYATVSSGDKWGIIDEYGQIVIPFKSDVPCHENGDYKYFVCSVNDRFAISTIDDGFPNDFPYDDILTIEGYADLFFVKQDGLWKMINAAEGDVPLKFPIGGFPVVYTKMYSLCFDDKIWTLDFCRPPFAIRNTQSKKCAYINSELKMTIPYADERSGERTYHRDLVIIKTNGKMGLANAETGKSITPTIYDCIRQYDAPGNLFGISDGASMTWYTVDKEGKVDNRGSLVGGRQGVINDEGEVIVPQVYQMISLYMHGDRVYDKEFTPYFIAEKLSNLKSSYRSDKNYYNRDTIEYHLDWSFDKAASSVEVYNAQGELVKRFAYDDYSVSEWTKLVK